MAPEELKYLGNFRLIIHEKMDGRLNMAIDECLLLGMKTANSRQNINSNMVQPVIQPVIRLYGFSPPTLSLGRFQNTENLLDMERIKKDGITVVRRPTGGQAVLHDDELTYSVILARSHIEPFRKRVIYNFVAKILLEGLKLLKVPAKINQVVRGDIHEPNCFATSGEYELVSDETSGNKKLIGSAQVTSREGVLQHGAIPIGDSFKKITEYLKTPNNYEEIKATCIEEVTGKIVSFKTCRQTFVRAIKSFLPVEVSELTEEEHQRAEKLFSEKYSTISWNFH